MNQGRIQGACWPLLLLLTAPAVVSADPQLTGDVPTDFNGEGVVIVTDPSGVDVGLPSQVVYPISGNDVEAVYFDLGDDGSTLFVGFDTFVIAGDVDGDGDPSSASPGLGGIGGTDAPDFGNTESFVLMIDSDEDGIIDVAAGVDAFTDLLGYQVAMFVGTPFAPSLSFGAPLPQHLGQVFGSPSALAPDLEFTILDLAGLPASSGMDDEPYRFAFTAFVGSFADAGIGEDFVPGSNQLHVVELCPDADGDGFSTCDGDCDDQDPSVNPGGSVCEPDKPEALRVRYTGKSCAESINSQDAGKFECDGDPSGESPVTLIATDRDDPADIGDSKARIYFDGTVTPGDEVFFDGRADGGFKSNSYVYVFSSGGALLQTVNFHTSCSQPLEAGDSFGSILIRGTDDANVGQTGGECPTDGGPQACEGLCEELGKPRVLQLQYTGESCDATSTQQDDDKVSCSGDPADEAVVFVRATEKSDPKDTGGKIWFEGNVELGGVINLDADNGGDDSLKSKTFVHTFDGQGNLLQSIEFHTSCSQPLFVGDRYGAFDVVGFEGDEEPEGQGSCYIPGEGDPEPPADTCDGLCEELGKPRILDLTYTGYGCEASSSSQPEDKLQCEGDPQGLPSIYVIATDKDDPSDSKAKTWFEGWVDVGDILSLDAALEGKDSLSSATFVYAFDASGELIHWVEFHTSCSKPLLVGDQFGTFLVSGFEGEDEPLGGGLCRGDATSSNLFSPMRTWDLWR